MVSAIQSVMSPSLGGNSSAAGGGGCGEEGGSDT
jgi:hypothetical protein